MNTNPSSGEGGVTDEQFARTWALIGAECFAETGQSRPVAHAMLDWAFDRVEERPDSNSHAHIIDQARYWLGRIDTRDPELRRLLEERGILSA
jgi:hypothetical protein